MVSEHPYHPGTLCRVIDIFYILHSGQRSMVLATANCALIYFYRLYRPAMLEATPLALPMTIPVRLYNFSRLLQFPKQVSYILAIGLGDCNTPYYTYRNTR